MQNFWKRTKIVLLVIFLIGMIVLSYFMVGSFSEGSRAGTIVKFSKKGVVFKTYEGELNMGMFITDNAAANYGSNIFNFSVPSGNKEVVETIEKVILTGSRVKMYYQEKYVSFLWVGESKYHIYKIDVLEK